MVDEVDTDPTLRGTVVALVVVIAFCTMAILLEILLYLSSIGSLKKRWHLQLTITLVPTAWMNPLHVYALGQGAAHARMYGGAASLIQRKILSKNSGHASRRKRGPSRFDSLTG